MNLEQTARDKLSKGNVRDFEEFLRSNSEQFDVKNFRFEDETNFFILLTQMSQKIPESNISVDDYKCCITSLVEIGWDINGRDSLGRTVAHWCIVLQTNDLLAVVLRMGCDVMVQDSEGQTIVHLAIRYGNSIALDTINLYGNDKSVFEKPSETSGATPLIYAVQIGAVDLVKKLLQLSVNVDAQETNKYKRTALHYALFSENEAIFEILLKNKAKSDIKDYKDKSVLDRAAEHPKDIFLQTVTHFSTNELPSSSKNNSPMESANFSSILIACKNGDFDVLCRLLETETEKNKLLNMIVEDSDGRGPLHYCSDSTDTKCAEKLLSIQPNLVKQKDKKGFTPLHLATISNNSNLVRVLLTNSANVDDKDNEGHSSLHWAVVCCSADIIDILLETKPEIIDVRDNYGAAPLHYSTQSFLSPEGTVQGPAILLKLLKMPTSDVNWVDEEMRTPLSWAASLGIVNCCQLLLENGANANARDKNGLTALHCAASKGHYDVVEMLVTKWGVPIDSEDNNLCTPLFYAVTLNQEPIIRFLLEHNSNPNQQDIKGRSVAHCASLKGYCDILQIIKSNGGSLCLLNKNGDLPIHEASDTGQKDVCEVLLNEMQKSNEMNLINSLNNNGLSPLHMAVQNNHHEICRKLIESGADVNLIAEYREGSSAEEVVRKVTPLDLAKDVITINLLKEYKGLPSSSLISSVLKVNKSSSDLKRSNSFTNKRNPSSDSMLKFLNKKYSSMENMKSNRDPEKCSNSEIPMLNSAETNRTGQLPSNENDREINSASSERQQNDSSSGTNSFQNRRKVCSPKLTRPSPLSKSKSSTGSEGSNRNGSGRKSRNRKYQDGKIDLKLKIIESVKEYVDVRNRMRAMADERRMELFQGYGKSFQLKTNKTSKPRSSKYHDTVNGETNKLELPPIEPIEIGFYQSRLPRNAHSSKHRESEKRIRSAYKTQAVINVTSF